jgi:hypothetical protein
METIALVSKALQEYERAGGFTPSAVAEAAEAALEAPAAGMESAANAFVPPPNSESREACLPQPTEGIETTAAITATGAEEVVDRVVGSSPSRPVAAGANEVRMPDEPTAAVQEQVAPRLRQELPPRRSKMTKRQGCLCCRARQTVKSRPCSSPAPRGRPLPGLATT